MVYVEMCDLHGGHKSLEQIVCGCGFYWIHILYVLYGNWYGELCYVSTVEFDIVIIWWIIMIWNTLKVGMIHGYNVNDKPAKDLVIKCCDMFWVLIVSKSLMWLGFWLSDGGNIIWRIVHVRAGWCWRCIVLVASIDEYLWAIDFCDEWIWFIVRVSFGNEVFTR